MVQQIDYLNRARQLPQRQAWFRAVGRVPDDETLHRCLLAYVSDFYLLDTATLPHGTRFLHNAHHGEHRSCDVVSPAAARG